MFFLRFNFEFRRHPSLQDFNVQRVVIVLARLIALTLTIILLLVASWNSIIKLAHLVAVASMVLRKRELSADAGKCWHAMASAVNWTKPICPPLKWMVAMIVLNGAKKAVAWWLILLDDASEIALLSLVYKFRISQLFRSIVHKTYRKSLV